MHSCGSEWKAAEPIGPECILGDIDLFVKGVAIRGVTIVRHSGWMLDADHKTSKLALTSAL
jgi:hypothetical protein